MACRRAGNDGSHLASTLMREGVEDTGRHVAKQEQEQKNGRRINGHIAKSTPRFFAASATPSVTPPFESGGRIPHAVGADMERSGDLMRVEEERKGGRGGVEASHSLARV